MSYSISTTTPPPQKGWSPLISQLSKSFKLWLWIMFLLFISRIILIWINRFQMEENIPASDFIQAFFTGFQFDAPVATIATLPTILISALTLLLPWQKVASAFRTFTAVLVTLLWLLITTATLIYFHNFHNQFDSHMLGALYDDQQAVITTLWKSYPVIQGGIALLILSSLLIWLARRWIRTPFPLLPQISKPTTIIGKTLFTLLLIATIILGLRGSLGRRPIQKKDAGRTTHAVLNRCIINPFSSLKYAIQIHLGLMRTNGLENYLGHSSPLKAFQEYGANNGNQSIKTIDEAFQHTAQGRPGKKPRHIFLIVMESYDGWTMLPQHADWHISDELKKLGQKGIYVQRFLSGSSGTMTSLASIISGLADAGVITNERFHPSMPAYQTAIAPQMKALGYETHFWYAGYASWQRIEGFCREQGFDHTHMAPEMGKDPDINEWGVSDKHLFSHILKSCSSNADTPTFNMIMTSSNHPPYSLDLKKEQCPITSVPASYQKKFSHGDATLKELGHLWYSDKWLGDFVRRFTKQHRNTLFAITGDHWGRSFPGPRPSSFEKSIVPLVLYGPGILPKNLQTEPLTGSHYDLGSTLIELAADPGFKYHAIGKNILTTTEKNAAISRFWILGHNFILRPNNNHIESLDGKKLSTPPESLPFFQREYNLIHGISWWRLIKGNQLPPSPHKPKKS